MKAEINSIISETAVVDEMIVPTKIKVGGVNSNNADHFESVFLWLVAAN